MAKDMQTRAIHRGILCSCLTGLAAGALGIGATALSTGCGGSGQAPPAASQGNQVQVALSAAQTAVPPGSCLGLTATVTGCQDPCVKWTVNGIALGNASVGTITGSGNAVTYTAPAGAGSYTICATSVVDSTRSASATVQVVPGAPAPPLAVALSPSSASLAAGASLNISAAVTGSSNLAVTWTVDGVAGGNASVGTVSGSGDSVTYTAPAAAGSHTVTATSTADATKSASATITVQASVQTPVTVGLAPGSASLNPGASANFTATVSGSSNTGVAWTVDGVAGGNASVGTVSGSGDSVTYTAPAAAGSHTLTATSAADSTKSAAASISVLAPAVTVSTSPATATLNPGGKVTLTATVGGTSNTAVTWTVDGVAGGNASVGTITGSGDTVTYTAPSGTGNHTVTAASAANPASTGSTAMTVQTSSGSTSVALAYAGPSATVNGSGSMLFTATVSGNSNTGVTWSVDGIASGSAAVGTVKGSGNTVLYQAPAAAGSHTVTATSAGDATKSASTAVTVAATAYTVVNPGNVLNVKTGYGATGNGSSDDTAAIQNAINAASSAGGGVVEVPAGTYMINLGYQGEFGLLMKSNVTLQLDAGATLKAKTGAPGTSNMIMFNGGSNMNIVGPGTLDGNKGSIGLDENIENVCFWGGSDIVLCGFTSQNAPGDGIYLNGYPSGAGVGAPVSNVLICNVTCTANGRNGMSPDGCDGLVVRDSSFSNQTSANPMNGIDCEPINNQAPNNFAIFNCTFANDAGGGIQSGPDDSGDNATFTNMTYAFNTVSNCGNYGLEAQDGSGPVNILYNTVSNTGPAYEFQGYGIMLRGSTGIRNVTILGNTVSGSKSDGIFLSSASSSTCTGNTVTGSGGKGINNQCGSGVTVSNNTESSNSGGN
jgi:parallel beta-helix repeat protein